MNDKEFGMHVDAVSKWSRDTANEIAIAAGIFPADGSDGPASIERRALALLNLRDAAVKLVVLARSTELLYSDCCQRVGEALVAEGKGGGVQVPEYKAAVLAGASFDVTLKIDDLCPPEALVPGATGYDLSIAAAESSAEQRLVNRLDSLGLGHMAPRQVDFETLAVWVEGHAQGAAVAIRDLHGTVEVKTCTVAEVMT